MIYVLLFVCWFVLAAWSVVWHLNDALRAEKKETARLRNLTEYQAKWFNEQLLRAFDNPFRSPQGSSAIKVLN
jgi:homoserine trans-succinylase